MLYNVIFNNVMCSRRKSLRIRLRTSDVSLTWKVDGEQLQIHQGLVDHCAMARLWSCHGTFSTVYYATTSVPWLVEKKFEDQIKDVRCVSNLRTAWWSTCSGSVCNLIQQCSKKLKNFWAEIWERSRYCVI